MGEDDTTPVDTAVEIAVDTLPPKDHADVTEAENKSTPSTDDVSDSVVPVKTEDAEMAMEGEEEDPRIHDYDLPVDPDQGYRATQLKICSFKRPHMRAFHYSWWSFFIAFFIWFSIAPLLPEVRETLGLTKQQIWITNISAVLADIGFRFLFGSLCDKFGARILMGLVLMMASVPTACTGLVNSLAGLTILRLFIGLAGSCFVMCQSWSSRMFTKEIAGTANAVGTSTGSQRNELEWLHAATTSGCVLIFHILLYFFRLFLFHQ